MPSRLRGWRPDDILSCLGNWQERLMRRRRRRRRHGGGGGGGGGQQQQQRQHVHHVWRTCEFVGGSCRKGSRSHDIRAHDACVHCSQACAWSSFGKWCCLLEASTTPAHADRPTRHCTSLGSASWSWLRRSRGGIECHDDDVCC